ncbi:MAG: serine hydrolase domain-containing protein [Acidimicrobiales bacterium]|jgi:CubicO group peptidase (beta-lactamase class C family)
MDLPVPEGADIVQWGEGADVDHQLDAVSAELEACGAGFVKKHRLPGASVGVVLSDGLAWSGQIGFSNLQRRESPRTSTLYAIASITKTFTGTAIMQLVARGLVALDEPVMTYLPELKDADVSVGPIEAVTIRRMLSHESGLAEEPPGTDWATYVREGVPGEVLRRASEIGTKVPPNTQVKYSNLAYLLLGEVVTRVSGTPYADYVRQEILGPLAMTSTEWSPLPPELDARRATGYNPRTFSDELDLAYDGMLAWSEAGLWSSVEDLARWLVFQLGAYAAPEVDSPILSSATLRTMHKPRYLVDELWNRAWGITWYGVRRDDGIWIQHSGGWQGFITDVCFDPVAKVGAIALLNGVGDAPSLAMDLGAIARKSLASRAPEIEPGEPTPDAYRSLLGVYFDSEYGELVQVEWRDAALMVLMPTDPAYKVTLLKGDAPDTFIVAPGVRPSGETCRFERRADGRVASMYLAVGTFQRLDTIE